MAQFTGKILIVDDDVDVRNMLYKVVISNDMQADLADSGEDALKMVAQTEYDLLLLDVNLPGITGFDVVEQMRRDGKKSPVIIISERMEDVDAVYALNIGADDYITKPFNPITLGAKIKALLRRSRNSFDNETRILKAGPFTYNTTTFRFYKNGEEIVLTGKENAMMKLFLDNVNRIFPKGLIYDMIWDNPMVDENTVMVYINHLRQKIEDQPDKPKYIQTVRGIGYRFVV